MIFTEIDKENPVRVGSKTKQITGSDCRFKAKMAVMQSGADLGFSRGGADFENILENFDELFF